MTWRQAIDSYGVDKPDTRFELLLRDLTGVVGRSGFRVFADAVAAGGIIKGICVKGGDDLSRSDIEGPLTEVARGRESAWLAYLWKREDGWHGAIAKFFTAAELEAIGMITGAQTGDCVLMVADRPEVVNAALGACATTSAAPEACTTTRASTCSG